MELGAFSVSLSVKDLVKSKEFYEALGFVEFSGDTKNYNIMKNGQSLIGLFQGMFEGNILTFNPGWDQAAQTLDTFADVRAIQKEIKEKGYKFESEADASTSGPANFMLKDPDGNLVMVDQHV